MTRLMRLGSAALPLLFGVTAANAAEQWSVLSGRTVGVDQTVIHGQAGWPGISATLLHGVSPKVDLGGMFAFNYGVENSTCCIWPELKFAAVGRLNLVDTPKYNVGIGAQPGLLLFFPSGGSTQVGVAIPLSFAAGFPISPQVMVIAGADVAFDIFFTSGSYVVIPILFGGGVEYAIEPNLLLTFSLRLGPVIGAGSVSGTTFGLNGLIGLAYKF